MITTLPFIEGVSAGDIIFVIAALFLGVAGLIMFAQLFLRNKTLTQELWLAYRLEFVVVGGLLVPAYFGGLFFLLVVLVFNFRALWELLTAYRVNTKTLLVRVAYFLSTLSLVAVFFFGMEFVGISLLLLLIFLQANVFRREGGTKDLLTVIACVFMLLLPLTFILLLRELETGFLWLFLVYLVIEINDAFALMTGKLLGRHYLLPKLSPKKTIEGMLGGVLSSFLIGGIFSSVVLGLSWGFSLGAVLIILLGGIFGDLFVSALKRDRAIKDFSSLHPSMGGALDIYDAIIFAAPAFYCYLIFLSLWNLYF